MTTTESVSPTLSIQNPSRNRLLSIDLLRGLTIGFMILVNDNGSDGAYWPLKHAAWNGFTPTDLVFPTFLFLVGITTVMSTASRLQQGASRLSLLGHTARRAVLLFLLGIVVNSFPFFHLATMRFYGVLPRIALCYLLVSILVIFGAGWRVQVALLVASLVGYWLLMRYVPIPGCGIPGLNFPLLDRDINLTAWIDRRIFSAAHLYERTRDPEGLLSTIPALGTALIGSLTGIWIRGSYSLVNKLRGIFAAGVAGVLLGGLWNLTFPINKKLWTSSYVLFAAGLSLLLLAFFILIADLRAKKQPTGAARHGILSTFLLVFGTNAIFAYVLSELLASTLGEITVSGRTGLGHWIFVSIHSVIPDEAFASLLYSLSFVGVCWLVVYFALYRRRIFIKI